MREEEMRAEDAWIAERVFGWHDIVTTVDHRKELVGVDPTKMRMVHRGQYQNQYLPVPKYTAGEHFQELLERCAVVVEDAGDSLDVSYDKHSNTFGIGILQVGIGWEIADSQRDATLPLALVKFAKKLFEK